MVYNRSWTPFGDVMTLSKAPITRVYQFVFDNPGFSEEEIIERFWAFDANSVKEDLEWFVKRGLVKKEDNKYSCIKDKNLWEELEKLSEDKMIEDLMRTYHNYDGTEKYAERVKSMMKGNLDWLVNKGYVRKEGEYYLWNDDIDDWKAFTEEVEEHYLKIYFKEQPL